MISVSLIFSVFGVTNLSAVLVMIYYAMQILGYYKLFDKAGESVWRCFIPILNEYTETKIAWSGRVYWMILALGAGSAVFSYLMGVTSGMAQTGCLLAMGLCFAGGVILNIKRSYRLAQAFGKGKGMALGILIFPPLFHMILGFGSAQYRKQKRISIKRL